MRSHQLVPIGHPFILTKDNARHLVPNKEQTQTIVLTRKYPLTGKFINDWAGMIGNTFEASNDSDFSTKEVLCTVYRTPVFQNQYKINNGQKYQFIRYVSNNTAPMAEIKIYGESGEIKLNNKTSTIANAERTIDNNTETRANAEIGYIEYELSLPQKITSIEFFPKNDGNFILPGHEYELLYFDDKWESIGKQVADNYTIRFENVPTNSLLLLKDLSGGHEERPFEYKDGKQIWW